MDLNPYLIFNGDCAEAVRFYSGLLGGEILFIQRFGDVEDMGPPEYADKVLHTQLRIGKRMLMMSDSMPGEWEKPQGFHVQLGFDDDDRAAKVFDALADGGTVTMPYGKTFWARGFGMCNDRFSIPWMVNYD